MPDEEKPSARRLGRVAALIVGIILLLWVIIFVFNNIAHYKDLKNEQATGNESPTYSGGTQR